MNFKKVVNFPHNVRKRLGNTRFLMLALAMAAATGLVVFTSVNALTTSNAHDRGVIAFVGDSNITINAAGIDWALTTGTHNDNSYTPVFISRVGSGIRTPDCIDTKTCTTNNFWKTKLGEVLPKVNADIYVNDLGINDTAFAGTSTTIGYANYAQKIDWFMKLIPAGKPVLWTNLPCAIEPPSRLTGCQTVNFALAQAPKRWPNLTILNWAAVANTHKEYITDQGNDVHYNNAGYAAWNQLVVDALDARRSVPN